MYSGPVISVQISEEPGKPEVGDRFLSRKHRGAGACTCPHSSSIRNNGGLVAGKIDPEYTAPHFDLLPLTITRLAHMSCTGKILREKATTDARARQPDGLIRKLSVHHGLRSSQRGASSCLLSRDAIRPIEVHKLARVPGVWGGRMFPS